MTEITYKLEVKIEDETRTHHLDGIAEIDKDKWDKINELCDYRKASIGELIEEFLERLTVEEAENILSSWDM